MSFLIALKKLFKSPVILLSLLFFVALTVCFLFQSCFSSIGISSLNTEGIIGAIHFSAYYLKYIFIFFLFVSYEFCKDITRDSISENLQSYNNSKIKLYFSHIAVLMICAFIVFLIFCLFNLISYQKLCKDYGITAPEFRLYILKFSVIYSFVLPLSAICMGALFSALFKRIGAYIAMLISVLLTLASQIEGIGGIFAIVSGDKVFYFIDLFTVFPDGLDRRSFFWSAYSISEAKYIKPLILILISITLLVIHIQKRKVNIKNILLKSVCIITCIFIIFEYIVPKSQLILTDDHPRSSTFSDVLNFGNNEFEQAKFKITSCKMEIKIDKKLSAAVEIQIDNSDKEELKFTLWNGFNVLSVKDKHSEKLPFKRDGNYIVITNSDDNDILAFEYHGFSNRFVANSDFVYLPGYFPYYPIAGKRYIINPQYEFAFNDNSYDYEVDFDITVNSKHKIYSNVSKLNNNRFRGKATSVCIFAGFIDEVEIDGVKLIYPYTCFPSIFRSSAGNEALSTDSNYLIVKKNIEKLKSAGIVKTGDIIVHAPYLGQQEGEQFMVTNDVVYALNVIGFSDESDEDILDCFNIQRRDGNHG